MRQKFYKAPWNTLLPEKLERHWTGASSQNPPEAREGPCSSAEHMGLIQAEARQELLALRTLKKGDFKIQTEKKAGVEGRWGE